MAQSGTILRNAKVPMRDGVRLATSVYLPPGAGPFPVVLIRTAYNRVGIQGPGFTGRGLALVSQDVRGRYDSEGEWYPFIHEAEDGFDTLEWIGRQPWCGGKVGMVGDSYLAATQLTLAPLQHPALAALNPRFMAGDCWKRAYYCDGAFSLALTWSWLCFECSARTSEASLLPLFDVPGILRQLPLLTLDEASGAGPVGAYRDYVTHSTYDDLWQRIDVRRQADCFAVPTFLIGGWYDYYAGETFANYLALREHAPTPELGGAHRVLVGPWTHGISPASVLGDLDFGPEALAENDTSLRWLECLLKGGTPSDFQEAPIRIFVMGANTWRDEWEWPLARTRYTPCYLRAGGRLSFGAPGDEAPDGFTYDPDDPVPTLGGNHSVGPYNPGLYEICRPGPLDQRPVEAREDVLLFTTDPLPEDLEVTGPVVVRLYASSSAPDTDFVARLTDVYPDGRSINITEGVLRARFREGVWGPPKLLTPDEVYPLTLDLQATSNLFRAGHRIRLQVTSSSFPLWDRNRNTGADPGTDTGGQVARQRVYHDRLRPSHVLLPAVGSGE